ncbi:hypothetical protein PMI36_04475 [Pseudomonas sp. GM79]|nr:hypothetical protein PMI36_04475 [Pseudomonas sp. GM79]
MAAFCKQRPTEQQVFGKAFLHTLGQKRPSLPLFPGREHSLDKAATYHTLGKQAQFLFPG